MRVKISVLNKTAFPSSKYKNIFTSLVVVNDVLYSKTIANDVEYKQLILPSHLRMAEFKAAPHYRAFERHQLSCQKHSDYEKVVHINLLSKFYKLTNKNFDENREKAAAVKQTTRADQNLVAKFLRLTYCTLDVRQRNEK